MQVQTVSSYITRETKPSLAKVSLRQQLTSQSSSPSSPPSDAKSTSEPVIAAINTCRTKSPSPHVLLLSEGNTSPVDHESSKSTPAVSSGRREFVVLTNPPLKSNYETIPLVAQHTPHVSILLPPSDTTTSLAYDSDRCKTRYWSLFFRNLQSFASFRPRTHRSTQRFLLVAFLLFCCFLTLSLFYFNNITAIWVLHLLYTISHYLRMIQSKGHVWIQEYERLLHDHPLASRVFTSAVIFFVADSIAQTYRKDEAKSKLFVQVYSLNRAVRYSMYGLLLNGPFLYIWYNMMHSFGPPDDLYGSILKALFESLTMEPLVIVMYMVYNTIVCRRKWSHLNQSVKSNFLPLWSANTIYWLPANFCNYYVGTPDLRVIFANTCSLFWNIYFSHMMNRKRPLKTSPTTSPIHTDPH